MSLKARAASRHDSAGSAGTARNARVSLLADGDHYVRLIDRELPSAAVAVWIATANLKELHVQAPVGTRARARGRYISIVEVLGELAESGVDVRILHGRAPSGPFAATLARRRLKGRVALRMCERVHMKTVTIDGRLLYLGSANFTGAGLGARDGGRRNFELGILTDDEYMLDAAQSRFDAIWSGRECQSCKLRRTCPKPIDTIVAAPLARPRRVTQRTK